MKLTPRERQVVELLVTGADNKLIAKTLGITVRTVKVHFEHMYRKNGITGGNLRAKLAVMAYRESAETCRKRNGNKLIQEGTARCFEKDSMTPEKQENAISGILKKRPLVPNESDVTEQ